MPENDQKTRQLIERINYSLSNAEKYTKRLRKTNMRLMFGGLVASTISVLVARGTAAQGPIVLTGTEGWRLSCIVAAIVSFVAAVCVGLVQQLKLSERISKGVICIGKLNALDLRATVAENDLGEIINEYEGILQEYAEEIS